jgi:hypothetical protein
MGRKYSVRGLDLIRLNSFDAHARRGRSRRGVVGDGGLPRGSLRRDGRGRRGHQLAPVVCRLDEVAGSDHDGLTLVALPAGLTPSCARTSPKETLLTFTS